MASHVSRAGEENVVLAFASAPAYKNAEFVNEEGSNLDSSVVLAGPAPTAFDWVASGGNQTNNAKRERLALMLATLVRSHHPVVAPTELASPVEVFGSLAFHTLMGYYMFWLILVSFFFRGPRPNNLIDRGSGALQFADYERPPPPRWLIRLRARAARARCRGRTLAYRTRLIRHLKDKAEWIKNSLSVLSRLDALRTSSDPSDGEQAKVRAVAADAHNRLMHALNGNIAPPEALFEGERAKNLSIVSEMPTGPEPTLAGAIPVLTEFLSGAPHPEYRVPGVDTFVSGSDDTMVQMPFNAAVPTDAYDNTIADDHIGVVGRRNRYLLSYPKGTARDPDERVDRTRARLLVRSTRNATIPVTTMPDKMSSDTTGTNYLTSPELAAYWDNATSADALSKAGKALQLHRYTGSAGVRQENGYDAHANLRDSAIHRLALADAKGQSYYRFMTRLWSNYFYDKLHQAIRTDTARADFDPRWGQIHRPAAQDVAFDLTRNRISNRVRLVPLSARAPIAAPNAAVNPEAPLQVHDPNNADPALRNDAFARLDALESGAAHFIDAQGLSDDELRLIIWALCPAESRYCWRFTNGVDRDAAGNWPANTRFYEAPHARISEALPPGEFTIYVHFGLRPAPTQAALEHRLLGRDAAPIAGNLDNSPWRQRPSSGLSARVIEHFIAKHHAANDAFLALDLISGLTSWWGQRDVPGTRGQAVNDVVLNAFGTRQLALPRDFTAPAYFDCVRVPMTPSTHAADVAAALRASPKRLLWAGYLQCHAYACSLNWVSYCYSMMGAEWRVFWGANPASDAQRLLVNGMTSRLTDDETNQWGVYRRKATALMYGFASTARTQAAVGYVCTTAWNDNRAAFIENPYHEMWMLRQLPHHMMFPVAETVPLWPNEPAPMATPSATDTPFVRVARDTALFSHRQYLNDGGPIARLNHYIAAQGAQRVWRSDVGGAGPDLRLESWNSPFQSERPAAPVQFDVPYLAPAGTVFGAYMIPGGARTYSPATNRVTSLGVSVHTGSWPTTHAWEDMTTGRQSGAVCVSYIMPAGLRVERPVENDFSMLFLAHESGNLAGLELREIGGNMAYQTSTPPGADRGPTTFPSHLMNHNDIDVPKGGYLSFRRGKDAEYQSLPRHQAGPSNTPSPPLRSSGPIMAALAAESARKEAAAAGTGPLIHGANGDSTDVDRSSKAAPMPDYTPKNPNTQADLKDYLAKRKAAPKPAPKPKREPRPKKGIRSDATQEELGEYLDREAKLKSRLGVQSYGDIKDKTSSDFRELLYLQKRIDYLVDEKNMLGTKPPADDAAGKVEVPPASGGDTSPIIEEANDAAAAQQQAQWASMGYTDLEIELLSAGISVPLPKKRSVSWADRSGDAADDRGPAVDQPIVEEALQDEALKV